MSFDKNQNIFHLGCRLFEEIEVIDSNIETSISGPKNCPVNGGWSDFTRWTACVKNETKGFRFCNNPEPSDGGENCKGDNFMIEACSAEEGKCLFGPETNFIVIQKCVQHDICILTIDPNEKIASKAL